MLPIIAEFFDTTVDALLGVTEAAKEMQIDDFWQRLNRSDSSMEHTKILREAHHAFPRNTAFTTGLCESLLYSDNPINNPDALTEIQILAKDVLEHSTDIYERERVILALVETEDEETAEKLIAEHASGENMTRSQLLLRRYGYRKEGEKERYLFQQEAAQNLTDNLLNGLTIASGDIDEKIASYRTALATLDTLTGCTNPNVVSGDGVPDLWCGTRIHLGNRMAAFYALKGKKDTVYQILEDNVAFFEKVCSLSEGTILSYRTPGLNSLRYCVEQVFNTQPNCGPDFGRLYKTTYFKPVDPPIKANTISFFPTTFTWALTDRECWNEFNEMREESRFQALAKRMTDAIESKDPV